MLCNSAFVLGDISSSKPGWSSWSEYGPCSSNCRKTRQRFCASSNKDVDCPGQSFGVETQDVVCPVQECNGKYELGGGWGLTGEQEGLLTANVPPRKIDKIRPVYLAGNRVLF